MVPPEVRLMLLDLRDLARGGIGRRSFSYYLLYFTAEFRNSPESAGIIDFEERDTPMKVSIVTAILFAMTALGAETKVKMESLPAAVQSAIQAQTKGATILGITSEKENGKTTYEVETKVNGKGRDVTFDQKGAVVETEDEVDLDSIPAAAKTALQKRAATGTITKVEKITEGSTVSYEAEIKTKAGKSVEAGVNADGSPHKDD